MHRAQARCICVSKLFQGVKAALIAAVKTDRLNMDARNGYQRCTVLGVEVVQIRNVLEVVRVKFAVIDDEVGLYIVGELGNLKGDILLSEDVFDDRKDLGVRRGRCGDRDALTL